MKHKLRPSVFIRYGVVVAVVAVTVVTIKIFTGRNNGGYTAPRPAVVTAYPERRTIDTTLTLSGHIEARSMVPVIPLVSGTILEYPAKAGMQVEKGDVLACIDEEPFRQQMLQAEAAYTGYESSFARVEQLYQTGAVTRQEYDSVKAQRDAAKAQYELAVLQLGYAQVSAPVSGTVLMAPASVGTVAAAPQPVAVIADLSDLVVRLAVPEKYFTLFNNDPDTLSARIIRPGEPGISETEICDAEIETVAPYIDGASKTFEVVIKLTGSLDSLRPGMYVKASVVFSRKENVPALPVTARKTDGSCYIFNPGSEPGTGTAEHIMLDASVSDGDWFMIPEQYAERQFIVSEQGTVFDGQPVTVVSGTGNTEGAAE